MNLSSHKKSQFIKKSGMLEIIEVKETMANLGGLSVLKKWLKDKAHIIRNLDKARKYGVDIPKGVMIVGMPGCGKSLSAKITADLFGIPLVRLDVGRLLGKYIGESEANMQRALRLSEEINPCVLWIDEIEKAFAGMSNGNGHEVTVRLFGQFLTWLQEKSNSVFVVATANDLSGMPPEFLRKGRFDEIFFVDLPNFTERKEILKLHLEHRSKTKTADIDVFELAKLTDGFSGADLESVIKESFEESFIEGRESITTQNVIKKINETKSISVTIKDKIDSLKERISKMDIKKASIDDRQD
ncbi:AAA family ATPase [Campylobacter hyointestinalis]|uniref:AAA family ATPase n=1 Tax=Campylobacter hyointestinalis TaxID=198 RepID=UPI0007C8E27F|nr:AAA family ATPase [Campylobacter hyointestinalis]